MPVKSSRVTLDLSPEERKKLKAAASLMGISMRTLIMRSLSKFLKRNLEELILEVARTKTEEQNVE